MRHVKRRISITGRVVIVFATCAVPLGSVHACIVFVPPRFEDVTYANLVLIGRIDNYRIIRDEAFRKRMLASPNLPAKEQKFYSDPKTGLMSDYARFEMKVEKVLVGKARGILSITWDNSTFSEPDTMKPGRYLVALRRAGSAMPPLRGPSATILPSPDPKSLTLLQAPCSSAFIYPAESEEARTIQRILSAHGK